MREGAFLLNGDEIIPVVVFTMVSNRRRPAMHIIAEVFNQLLFLLARKERAVKESKQKVLEFPQASFPETKPQLKDVVRIPEHGLHPSLESV